LQRDIDQLGKPSYSISGPWERDYIVRLGFQGDTTPWWPDAVLASPGAGFVQGNLHEKTAQVNAATAYNGQTAYGVKIGDDPNFQIGEVYEAPGGRKWRYVGGQTDMSRAWADIELEKKAPVIRTAEDQDRLSPFSTYRLSPQGPIYRKERTSWGLDLDYLVPHRLMPGKRSSAGRQVAPGPLRNRAGPRVVK
jgi:hypothetical protein